MNNRNALLAGILLVAFFPLKAQFSIESEFRPRFEMRDGYKKLQPPGAVPACLITQRSRLKFNFSNDGLRMKFTLQDVRIWGDERLESSTGVFGDSSSVDLYEACGEIRLGDAVAVVIGRQELVYDNERLLSRRNWNQNGLTYDAVVLKFRTDYWNIHAGGTWNTLRDARFGNHYLAGKIKTLDFLWLNREAAGFMNYSATYIASGVPVSDTSGRLLFRHTSGIYLYGDAGTAAYRAAAYYQFGRNSSGVNVSAWLSEIDVSVKTGMLTPGFGVTLLSGNNSTGADNDHLFDLLYGTRHRYLGHMDYFSDIPSSTKGGGLTDVYGYLTYALNDHLKISVLSHAFFLGQVNEYTSQEHYLGCEQEIGFDWEFRHYGKLKAAWLIFKPSSGFAIMQGVPGATGANFLFIELSLNPVLLIRD